MASGENLYGIARRYKVKAEELQSANGITDVRKVRPGVTLKVPGTSAAASAAPRPALAPAPAATALPGSRPTIINSREEAAEAASVPDKAAPTRVASAETPTLG